MKVLTFFENEKANKQFVIPIDQTIKKGLCNNWCSKENTKKN